MGFNKNIDLRRWTIGEQLNEGYVSAIGLVGDPAIGKTAILFNETKTEFELLDEDEIDLFNELLTEEDDFEFPQEELFVGPIMTPNKLIVRTDYDTGNPYYGYWSREEVYNTAQKLMKLENQNNLNLQHDHFQPAEGVYLVEIYLVRDENQAEYLTEKYGTQAVIGELWAAYKIDNEDIKDQIRNGEINGFSIEIYQGEEPTNI